MARTLRKCLLPLFWLLVTMSAAGCTVYGFLPGAKPGNECPVPGLMGLYHTGAQNKPIFPVVIGVVGRRYPAGVLRAEPIILLDSASYARVAAAMLQSVPASPTPAQRDGETGTFLLCLGTQTRYLTSRHDSVLFLQALLQAIAPRSEAERELHTQLQATLARL